MTTKLPPPREPLYKGFEKPAPRGGQEKPQPTTHVVPPPPPKPAPLPKK